MSDMSKPARRGVSFEEIIGVENLLIAWNKFKKGKGQKWDVQRFALDLEDNLFELHDELGRGAYRHSPYISFYVRDPKLRRIHKPAVRDRVLHHALTFAIEPLFERGFIFNSYSSRRGKGTHAAVSRFRHLAWRMSRNNTRTVWALHCDVRKFFDSIDHDTLLRLIGRRVDDRRVLGLIEEIVRSYHTEPGKGLPLGNLTSQLFSNIYLDGLDQFINKKLGVQNYIRYADDVAVIAGNKTFLECLVAIIRNFLGDKLLLTLHPQKTTLRKWHQGVDFLGYVTFPHYAVLRTKTKRRMLRSLRLKYGLIKSGEPGEGAFMQSLLSYFGVLRHGRGCGAEKDITGFIFGPDFKKCGLTFQGVNSITAISGKVKNRIGPPDSPRPTEV